MEGISIESGGDNCYNYSYTMRFGGKDIITTRVRSYFDDLQSKQWIREVQIVYAKRNRQTLFLALTVDRSANYSNGPNRFDKGNAKDESCELLKLCVGRHCLLYEVDPFSPTPKALKDFLYDRRTLVVGLGIEQIAKKLEKDNHLLIPRRVELSELAKNLLQGETTCGRLSVEKLEKVVLGEGFDLEKPKKMKWFSEASYKNVLSDDLISIQLLKLFLLLRWHLNCCWIFSSVVSDGVRISN